MAYRTVNYAKCHRCGNANDRGSQRTCSSCHVLIQREYRASKRNQIEMLEEALAVALARAVAAESKLAALGLGAPREVARKTFSMAESAA